MKTKILLIAIILSLFLVSCQSVPSEKIDVSLTENGVLRSFEKNMVSPGEEIIVKLYINLNEDQTYYLLEDAVPAEFVVVDQDKNKIKLIERIVYSKNHPKHLI